MKVYFAPLSRATRARWILEELDQPYELVTLDLMKWEQRQPSYLKVHPLGAVPAIDDDGFTMFESAAIVMQLADKFPEKGLAPAVGTNERGEYYQWILFAVTEVEPPLVTILQYNPSNPTEGERPLPVEKAIKRFKFVASAIQERMKNRQYILGNKFTAADVMMGGVIALSGRIGQLGDHPELAEYAKRLMERPAAKKAYGP